MRIRYFALPALAVGLGSALLLPTESVGFSTIGGLGATSASRASSRETSS